MFSIYLQLETSINYITGFHYVLAGQPAKQRQRIFNWCFFITTTYGKMPKVETFDFVYRLVTLKQRQCFGQIWQSYDTDRPDFAFFK